MTPEMTQEMTPIMTSEMIVSEEVVVDLSLLVYNPMIECPVDVQAHMKVVYIFTQWYSQIPENVSGLVSMTDASLLGHFDVYYTYINSKKCKAIRKTKEMYPTVNYEKKNKTVLDSEGNVVVAEKKKRVSKKKEVNVEVVSDVVIPVVAEKKKRVSKKKEVNVEVVVSDVVENVVVDVVEKNKRTKKTVAAVVDVAEKKKKSAKKTKVVAEEDDEEITEEDVANAMQYLQDMEERMQELEEED